MSQFRLGMSISFYLIIMTILDFFLMWQEWAFHTFGPHRYSQACTHNKFTFINSIREKITRKVGENY